MVAYELKEEYSLLKQDVEKYIETFPNEIEPYLISSRIYRIDGNNEEADKLLKIAREKINAESSFEDISRLMEEFSKNSDFKSALEVINTVVKETEYSHYSLSLIDLYVKSGNKSRAIELCEIYTEKYGLIEAITATQIDIYKEVDDYPRIIAVCQKHLNIYPDDYKIRIALIHSYNALGQHKKAKPELENIEVQVSNLGYQQGYGLANLFLKYKLIHRGKELAFKLRQKYPNEVQSHETFLQLFSMSNELRREKPDYHTAIVGSVVHLKEKITGKGEYYFLVKKTDPENFPTQQLLVTESFGRSIHKAKVGDIVNSPNGQEHEVTKILTKYTHAFQESIELIKTRFSDVSSSKVFTVGKTGNPREDFKHIFESLEQDEIAEKELNRIYLDNQLPIEALASIANKNPIKLWHHVIHNSKLGLFHYGDNFKVNYSSEKPLVLGLVSLLGLFKTNNLHLLEKLQSKPIIVSSVVEIIRIFILEFETYGEDGSKSLINKNGRTHLHEVSSETVASEKEKYQSLLEWIRNSCDVLPCRSVLKFEDNKRKELYELYSQGLLESILLAKEQSAYLLADEGKLRDLVKLEYDVLSISIQHLLLRLIREKKVNQSEYDKCIVQYIDANYKILSVSPDILCKCLDISKETLLKGIKNLNYRSCTDENIAVGTFCKFLHLLHSTKVVLPITIDEIIRNSLTILLEGRNIMEVSAKVIASTNILFKLLQPQKDRVVNLVQQMVYQSIVSRLRIGYV